MIIFYNKITNNIFSYICYTLERVNGEIVNLPSKCKCAANSNINEENIGIVEWTKVSPKLEDFKDSIIELNQEELEYIS
jgi:hypothetical protein